MVSPSTANLGVDIPHCLLRKTHSNSAKGRATYVHVGTYSLENYMYYSFFKKVANTHVQCSWYHYTCKGLNETRDPIGTKLKENQTFKRV